MNRQEAFEAWWSGLDGNYECYGEENNTNIAKNAWQAAWKARGEQDAKLCAEFSDSGFMFADAIRSQE